MRALAEWLIIIAVYALLAVLLIAFLFFFGYVTEWIRYG